MMCRVVIEFSKNTELALWTVVTGKVLYMNIYYIYIYISCGGGIQGGGGSRMPIRIIKSFILQEICYKKRTKWSTYIPDIFLKSFYTIGPYHEPKL